MNFEELRNLIECYRPDRDGLDEAELAALNQAAENDPTVRQQLETVGLWDAAIERAMHDVPVPEGLESRLLSAVASDPPQPTVSISKPWWNRWPARVTVAAVVTAAAILIMIPILGWNDSLTSSDVAAQTRGWIVDVEEQPWQRTELPKEALEHRKFFNLPIDGWQRTAVLGDEQAIACRATVAPGRTGAWLFVIKSRKGRLLPSRPPQTPDSTTGNICIGVWKDGGYIHVLATNSRSAYNRLLRSAAYASLWHGSPSRG